MSQGEQTISDISKIKYVKVNYTVPIFIERKTKKTERNLLSRISLNIVFIISRARACYSYEI
ncbi:MAG TPA: hypothetical protein VGE97_08380, partial [Nitrososphaera sp.]